MRRKEERENFEEFSLNLEEEEEQVGRNRELEDIGTLKKDVAENVKVCLMKIYKKRENKLMRNEDDFTNLARKLSHKIREEIMERHQLSYNNLVGVTLSQQDREEIVDEVLFYCIINKIVRKSLLRPEFSEVQHEFEELVKGFCEDFHQRVWESIRLYKGSMKEKEVRTCYEETIVYSIRQILAERSSQVGPSSGN